MDQRDVAKDGRNTEGDAKVLLLAKKISASGDNDKWLQKHNLALKPIL